MQVQLAETSESVELFVEQKLCKSPVLHKPLRINLFRLPVLDTTLFGIIWRTSYVSASTGEHGMVVHVCVTDSRQFLLRQIACILKICIAYSL